MVQYSEIKHYKQLVQGYKNTIENLTEWNNHKAPFFSKKLKQAEKKLQQLEDDYANEQYDRMKDNEL